MTGTHFDPRLNAFRPDLADERLMAKVTARRFTRGTEAHVVSPLCPLLSEPSGEARQLTQALMGEAVRVFETKGGWSWLQLQSDGYVGYARQDALTLPAGPATHKITVPSTFCFSAPDIKSRPLLELPLNARICAGNETDGFLGIAGGGFVYGGHCAGLAHAAADWVTVAEWFLGTPYLWGGKSMHGIDCSGLVQTALQAAGKAFPRDSDLQEGVPGLQVARERDMRRGDLVFWKGHVGVMRDAETLLHANAHHLMVVSEPLASARSRIAAKGSEITSVKRFQ